MKAPLISIVIPVYNVAQYLDECIQSVFNQTYTKLEIILVDDGSTDDSPRMCDAYADQDSRVRVVHKKNGGLSSARNTGIESATGEFITFVDSDDTIEKDMVAQLLCSMDDNTDVSVCGLTSDQNMLDVGVKSDSVSLMSEEALREIYMDRMFTTTASAKLYRTSLFNAVRYPIGLYFEDYATTYLVFALSKEIRFVDSRKYYYRNNPTGITKGSFKVKWLDYFDVSEAVYKFTKENYPQLANLVKQREVHYAVSFFRFARLSDFSQKQVMNTLVSHIRGSLGMYLSSHFSMVKKLSALLIAVCPGLASVILKHSGKLY